MVSLREEALTSPSDVSELLEDHDLTDAELNGFINRASFDVEDIADAEPDTSEERLEEIEKWQAAHYATVRLVVPESERQESYRVKWQRETTYGMTAQDLDPSNVLSQSGAVLELGTPDAKNIRD